MNEYLIKRMKTKEIFILTGLSKTLKLFLVLMLLITQSFMADVFAQNVNVKLSLKNPTVAEVVERISSQTGYQFSYDAEILSQRLEKNLSFNLKNERIETVLSRVFDDSDFSFKVLNNRVFLKSNKTIESSNQTKATSNQPQGKTISGTIVDANGEPVIGASVVVQGDATKGTITDYNGKYTLNNVPENATIAVSYVGMKTQNIPLAGKSSIDITLDENPELLDEVVVVGYGTVRKSDLTGSVGSVKAEIIEKMPVSQVDQALQGRISGMQITSLSGAPGASTTIRIRGGNSINANNEPLYVIDGFILPIRFHQAPLPN